MLPQVDTLPGAQCTAPLADGNVQIGLGENSSHMSRHVIAAFGGVMEHGITIRHRVCHESLKIVTYLGIGIFAQDQRSTGMTDKNMTQARGDTGLGNRLLDLAGNIIGTPTLGHDIDFFLNHH